MKKTVEQLFKLVLLTLAGLAGSVIVGLMSYGSDVFNVTSPGFLFVSFGLSGAFIFSFYHMRGLAETITAAVVVSVIQFVGTTPFITMLNAGIWSFGVNLPMVALAFIFERKLGPLKQAKFIVVALTYGAMFVLLTLVVAWVSASGNMPASLFRQNFTDGVLIGLGLGVGIEAGEAFMHSLGQVPTTPAQRGA
jgi:hypothetical protein